MSSPDIAMMMAMDRNRLIGKAGQMPWRIPGELAYFKSVTLGKPVIMGRKTFDSIGRPLPGRTNIVVTRNKSLQIEGVSVVKSLEMGIQIAEKIEITTEPTEIMIIGGAELCKQAMPLTKRLYLTVIDQAFDGDTWLDSFFWDQWTVVSEKPQDVNTTGGIPVTYWVLEKATQ